jgi:hypothetical protein
MPMIDKEARTPTTCEYFIKIKGLRFVIPGGSEQIRTAVEGFADLCLTTRPRNHFFKTAKIGYF